MTRPFLSDRARVVVGILGRYGAHNRPTTITDSERDQWFADGRGVDAILECLRVGAVIVHGYGNGWCILTLAPDGPAIAPLPPVPTPEKRKPRGRKAVH